MNIFAFPHAGGDSYCYRNLKNSYKLGNFETLTLPGRGKRYNEPCLFSIQTMAEEAVKEFAFESQKAEDFCFYGHSMGALLAYQTTWLLKSKNLPLPKLLFLSGRKSPRIKSEISNRHKLPSPLFRKELEALGGCSKEVLANNELMGIFEPILRADFQAVETYSCDNIERLNVKIVLFHGTQDHFTPDEIKAWQEETSESSSYYEFNGGHFFIHNENEKIISIIKNHIQELSNNP